MIRAGIGLLLVWVMAALLVRGVFGDLLALGGVRPDLLTLVVVYWGLAAGPMGGTLAGFLVGLVADADLGRGLGLQAGLLSAVGFAAGQAGRHLIREHLILQAAVSGIAALVVGFGRALVLTHDAGGHSLLPFLPSVLASAAYTALLGPALYWTVRVLRLPDPLARVHPEE